MHRLSRRRLGSVGIGMRPPTACSSDRLRSFVAESASFLRGDLFFFMVYLLRVPPRAIDAPTLEIKRSARLPPVICSDDRTRTRRAWPPVHARIWADSFPGA